MKLISIIIAAALFFCSYFAGCAKAPSGPVAPIATPTATFAIPPFKAQWSFPLSSGPQGIAIDKINNFVYATQWYPGAVVKFDMSGNVITTWGVTGSGDGQLSFVASLAVDSAGDVYVCDDGNERVQKFSPTGTYLLQWGSEGTADGQFSGAPIGIAADSSGNFFVTDQSNDRVQKFSPTGTFLSKFGASGTGDGEFQGGPAEIFIDASDNIFVSDFDGRVQKFSSAGVFMMKFGGTGFDPGLIYSASAIAVAASGNIFISDWGNNRIQVFSPQGVYITHWGNSFGVYGTGPGEFSSPQGVAFDSAGNLYVADYDNTRIQIFGY